MFVHRVSCTCPRPRLSPVWGYKSMCISRRFDVIVDSEESAVGRDLWECICKSSSCALAIHSAQPSCSRHRENPEHECSLHHLACSSSVPITDHNSFACHHYWLTNLDCCRQTTRPWPISRTKLRSIWMGLSKSSRLRLLSQLQQSSHVQAGITALLQ